MASISSFSEAPARFSRSAACPRSATRPSSRCSTEAYLSPKFFVKSTARWMTRDASCEKYCSPLPPSTRGSCPTARSTSPRSPRTFTPTRPSRKVASESSSRISTASMWSGSTACCPRSRARVSAACSASCALMVKVLMFISVLFYCFPISIPYRAKGLPRSATGHFGTLFAENVTNCHTPTDTVRQSGSPKPPSGAIVGHRTTKKRETSVPR